MEANVYPPEERFKKTLLELIDFSGHIIMVGKKRGVRLAVDENVIPWVRSLIWLMSNQSVVKRWINSSKEQWDSILSHDTDDFVANIDKILPDTSQDFQDALVILLRDHRIGDNEKDIFWSYFDALVTQASAYMIENE